MKSIGSLFVTICIFLYNSFAWGYVGSIFYNWFVLPSFPDFPNFGYTEFIGFNLFVSVLTNKTTMTIKDEYKDKQMIILQLLVGPWAVLFMGWLIKIVFF